MSFQSVDKSVDDVSISCDACSFICTNNQVGFMYYLEEIFCVWNRMQISTYLAFKLYVKQLNCALGILLGLGGSSV